MPADRWVVLDVGETLIDESRVWTVWADVLGIAPLTVMAAIGAAIVAGGEHGDLFTILERPGWRELEPEVERRYGGFQAVDLYADALPAMAALRQAGFRLAVAGNQPARRHAELEALGVLPDAMAMSDELGAAKPDAAFFIRTLELLGGPDPGAVAYVGDRTDNDVAASAAAGLRPVWIRRGPWGYLQRDGDRRAALTVRTLSELAERIDEAWR
jgi:HAD superfamily hydrolase (TIGR01549 family)